MELVEISRMGVKLIADTKEFNAPIDRSVQKIENVALKFASIGTRMSLAITAPLTLIARTAVREFAKFDDAMTKSTAIMDDLTDKQMESLKKTARTISTEGVTSIDKLAQAYYYLASAGYSVQQSQESLPFLEKFAVAGAFDLARATDLLADSQAALGLKVDNTTQNLENMIRVGNVMTKAGILSNLSTEQIATSFVTKSAAATRLLGKEVEETAAVLSVFAEQGIKAELAGERLSIVWRDLQAASIKQAAEWKKMGITVYDTNGQMLNTADIVEQLERAFSGLSDEERKMAFMMLGFQERSVEAVMSLLGTSQRIRYFQDRLSDAGGTVQTVADKQMRSFQARIDNLSNRIKILAADIGQDLTSPILKMAAYVDQATAAWSRLTVVERQNVITAAALIAVAAPSLILLSAMSRVVVNLTAVFLGLANVVMFLGRTVIGGILTAAFRVGVALTTALVRGTIGLIAIIVAEAKAYVAASATKATAARAYATATFESYRHVWTATTMAAAGFLAQAKAADVAEASLLRLSTTAFALVPSETAATTSTGLMTIATNAQTTASTAASGALIAQSTANLGVAASSQAAAGGLVIQTTATAASTASAGVLSKVWTGAMFVLRGIGTIALGVGKRLLLMALLPLLPFIKIIAIVAAVGAAIVGLAYLLVGPDSLKAAWAAIEETIRGVWIITTEWLSWAWKGLKGFLGFTEDATNSMKGLDKASQDAEKAQVDATKALADAQKAAEKAMADSEDALKNAGIAADGANASIKGLLGPAGEAAKDLQTKVDDVTKALREQAETFGMTAAQADVHRLKMEGATEDQLSEAKAIAKKIDALEKERDAREEMKQVMEKGKQLTEQFLTPQEKFAKTQKENLGLLRAGAISVETFHRATKAALEDLQKNAKIEVEVEGWEHVEAGTRKAMERLQEHRKQLIGTTNAVAGAPVAAPAARPPAGMVRPPVAARAPVPAAKPANVNPLRRPPVVNKPNEFRGPAFGSPRIGPNVMRKQEIAVDRTTPDEFRRQPGRVMAPVVRANQGSGAAVAKPDNDTKAYQTTTEGLLTDIATNTKGSVRLKTGSGF